MGKWQNWMLEKEYLKPIFDEKIEKEGRVKIYTICDHVSKSNMTAYCSAFVATVDEDGIPGMRCIAREVKYSGCGYSRQHQLAYDLFHRVYEYGEPPYQSHMLHLHL